MLQLLLVSKSGSEKMSLLGLERYWYWAIGYLAIVTDIG